MSNNKHATFKAVAESIEAVSKKDLKSVVVDAAIEAEVLKLKTEGIKIFNTALSNIEELENNLAALMKQPKSEFRHNGEGVFTEDKVYSPETMKKINTVNAKLKKTKESFDRIFGAEVTIGSLRNLEAILKNNKPEPIKG